MGEPHARKDSMQWLVKLFGITLPSPISNVGNPNKSAEIKKHGIVVPLVNGHGP